MSPQRLESGLDLVVSEDELVPHWVPPFAPARPLADDLVAELPHADRGERREWTAAILWAAALDAGMDRDEWLWAHVVDDITTATGVLAERARGRFEQVRELGLARPRREPSWWRDGEPDSDLS